MDNLTQIPAHQPISHLNGLILKRRLMLNPNQNFRKPSPKILPNTIAIGRKKLDEVKAGLKQISNALKLLSTRVKTTLPRSSSLARMSSPPLKNRR